MAGSSDARCPRGCPSIPAEGGGRSTVLYRVLVPDQNLVVRINGLDPDAPEDDYLPALRPYGVLRMAWAIWREVPDARPKESLALAARVRRKGRAEVLTATPFLAEHVSLRLLARHRLVARLERAG